MQVLVNKLKKAYKKDLLKYRPIPFWSWNNALNEKELERQIEEMYSTGVGGFIIHARMGLIDEYLGEKWFSCVDLCLKTAKRLKMRVWIYDENGYPSGFVGGKLLQKEDFRARFLRYEIKSFFDENAFCVYKQNDNGYERVFCGDDAITEYHCVYLIISPSNTDILNPELTDAFIAETHEKYYARFKKSFGKELAGFFTDEPQFYRYETPYAPACEKFFKENYGENVKDGLVYLFLHDERGYSFRQKYYSAMNYLYVHNYYERLYKWCGDHNCELTGHSVEETSLYTQMWGGAACMPTYEYEHIPGVDCLERNCWTELAPKQVASVASQRGKKFVLTESFGCAGYDATPKELKSLGDYQYFNGVNLLCHHLVPYSIAGQGKYDNPPIFSKQNNWWDKFHIFNEYFTRLGYIIANTEERCDVLIIHPMRDIWLEYIRKDNLKSVSETEKRFADFIVLLRKKGVLYHFADETILEKYGKVGENGITIGKRVYSTVIVPEMDTIAKSTYDILKIFGGKIFFVGKPKFLDGKEFDFDLKSNVDFNEIITSLTFNFTCEDGKTQITSRKGRIGDYVFLKNYSRTEESFCEVKGISKNYQKLDLLSLKTYPVEEKFYLKNNESVILIKDTSLKKREIKKDNTINVEDITTNFSVKSVTDNALVLDYGFLSYDGINFGAKEPLTQLFEELLRADYKGRIFIKQTFILNDKVAVKLRVEKNRYFIAQLNGKDINFKQSDYDMNFIESDITDALVIGENEFIYGVDYYQHDGVHFALFDPLATGGIRTCLYYDTHIENSYLIGDFIVNDDFSISKRDAYPPVTVKNYEYGFKFFAGNFTYCGHYFYDGNSKRTIEIDGRFCIADITVNGKPFSMVLETKADITDALIKGENEITIVLRSSLRNLYGPHHLKGIEEPMGVCPTMFTMRGDWGNGISQYYTHDYHFVDFGINKIIMTEENI